MQQRRCIELIDLFHLLKTSPMKDDIQHPHQNVQADRVYRLSYCQTSDYTWEEDHSTSSTEILRSRLVEMVTSPTKSGKIKGHVSSNSIIETQTSYNKNLYITLTPIKHSKTLLFMYRIQSPYLNRINTGNFYYSVHDF